MVDFIKSSQQLTGANRRIVKASERGDELVGIENESLRQ